MMISEVLMIFMAITWTWWYTTFKLWFLGSKKQPEGYEQANQSESEILVKKEGLQLKLQQIFKVVKIRKWFICWICSWLTFWFSVYYVRIADSCREINRGLVSNNAYSNEGGECKWERSNICWHYTVEGIYQPFFWGRDKCTDPSFIDDLSEYKEV